MAPTRTLLALESRLSRHFALCALLAAASSSLVTDTADAAIRHRTYNLPIAADVHGLYLNVETGAVGSRAEQALGWDLNPYGPTALTFYNAPGTGMLRAAGSAVGSAALLPPQAPIDATGSYGGGSVVFGTDAGNWQLNATNLFGFKFIAGDGLVRFGWGRIEVGPTFATRTLVELAYEESPATPILAGAMPGTPPTYNPCAATNPTVSVGANLVPLEQSSAPDLDLRGTPCGLMLRRANAFRFTAPVTGSYTVSTCASGANTRLAVLSDCSATATPVACNDDYCGQSSSVTFTATVGTSYYVAVGATLVKATLPSPMAITITAPTLPACAQAGVLQFGVNAFNNTTAAAAQEVRSSTSGAAATIRKAVWHRFVPAVTGAYTFSMCGSTGDSMIAVGEVCPGAGARFESLGFNDDFCACTSGCIGNYAAMLTAYTPGLPLAQDLVAGRTYYVVAGSYAEGASVSATLLVDGPPQPPSNPADLNGDGHVNAQDIAILLSQWGGAGSADLDGNGVVGSPDLAMLLNAWG